MIASPEFIRRVCRTLSVFENDSGSPETDYASIYVYHDGPGKCRQVTLARGFTQFGGSLRKVIDRYIAKKGAQSELLKSRLPKFGKTTLADDKEFTAALHTAASEKAMQEAQDEVFEEVYLQPALAWATNYKFVLLLSVGVVVDSYLHSGRMPDWLMAEFPERKPSSGGDEKAWIIAYLRARLAWFARVSGALHNTMYRPQFFLREIARGNWGFDCPITCNGSPIC